MSIKMIADSTCDLSPAVLKQHDIGLVPLYVSMGDKMYQDGVDVRPDDLYAYVEQTGKLPSTAAINVANYQELFASLSAQYDAVVHTTISSDFSSCYQNACIAAQEFDNVYVVDSRNLSTGHGHVALEGALAAERGTPVDQIVADMNALTGRVEASFVVDQLDYLVKGGRCSAAAALGANLLKLKPCIEVRDGKMGVGKKYRGSFEKALENYVKDRLEGRDDLVLDRIFLTHTRCDPAIVELVRQLISKYAPFKEIIETEAGATVASHCGPNTLGILFIRSK